MKTIDEIRRTRLAQLVQEIGHGSQSQLARHLDKDRRQISLWLAPEGRPGKRIGQEAAREIEKRCGKPVGWMDQLDNAEREGPTPASQPTTLDPTIMAQAEAMVQTVERLRGSALPPMERGAELVRWYRLVAEGGSIGPNELLRPADQMEGGFHGVAKTGKRPRKQDS